MILGRIDITDTVDCHIIIQKRYVKVNHITMTVQYLAHYTYTAPMLMYNVTSRYDIE